MKGESRIISIDPTSHGFGFVVLEGSDSLIDWGHACVRPCTNAACYERIAQLMRWHVPDIVVLEDLTADARRGTRVRKLLNSVAGYAERSKAEVVHVPVSAVRKRLAEQGLFTKDEIARAYASEFEELLGRVPPPRQIWMSEDERTSMFDALGLALIFLNQGGVMSQDDIIF